MTKRTRLNLEAIKTDAENGLTVIQIAESQKASYAGIFNFCRKNNIEVKSPNKKLTVEGVKEDVENRLSQASIADKNGVSAGTVSVFLRANGLIDLYNDLKSQRPKTTRSRKVPQNPALSEDQSTDVISNTEESSDEDKNTESFEKTE